MSSPPEHPAHSSRLRRNFYGGLGFLFVGLAVLGAVLPLLPTTPFLLLASYFFLRSFPRWNDRLLNSRLFGPLLREWQYRRAVRLHVKVTAISVMLVTLSASAVFGNLSLPWLAVLLAAGSTGLIVVLRLPVVPADASSRPELRAAEIAGADSDELAA